MRRRAWLVVAVASDKVSYVYAAKTQAGVVRGNEIRLMEPGHGGGLVCSPGGKDGRRGWLLVA